VKRAVELDTPTPVSPIFRTMARALENGIFLTSDSSRANRVVGTSFDETNPDPLSSRTIKEARSRVDIHVIHADPE